MDRRRRRTAPEPAALSDEAQRVAERLQQLSVDEAERILQRAIELQTRAPGADPAATLDTHMLAQIAEELDIDQGHLHQALLEELLKVETESPGALDRIVGPTSITVYGAAPGDLQSVHDTVDAWMINHEGMRKRAEDASVTQWEKDRGLGAVMRTTLRMSRGPRNLRTTSGVTTWVRPATDDEQIVVIEADTSNLRRLAIGLLAGAAAIGGATAAASGAIGPSGFGLGDALAGAGTFAVLGGFSTMAVRIWIERIRDGLSRALGAIRSPHLVDRGTTVPSALRRFVDGLRGAVDRGDRDGA